MPEAFLICARVIEGGAVVVAGSTQAVCSQCSVPVWIAPSSQPTLVAGAKILCGRCGSEKMREDEGTVTPLTVAQIKELVGLLMEGKWYQGRRGPSRVAKGADIHEQGERIALGHSLATELGFTKDKFEGWLWLDGGELYVSSIKSLRPNEGNLTALLSRMLSAGFLVKIPTPFPAMHRILVNNGFKRTWEYEPLAREMCEVWVKVL